MSKVHILFYSVAEREVRGASVVAFLPRGAPCVNLILQSVAERGVRGGATIAAFLPRGGQCDFLICYREGVRGGASVAAFPPCGVSCVNFILHSFAERAVRDGATIAAFPLRAAPCNSLICCTEGRAWWCERCRLSPARFAVCHYNSSISVAEREVRGGASGAAFLPRGAPCVTAWCEACWPGARGAATAVTSITCVPGAAATDAPTARPAAAISASTAEIRIPHLIEGRVQMGADVEPSQAVGKFAQLCTRTVTLNHCCGSALYLCADPDPGSQTNMDPSGSGSCSDVRS